ncbi:MAG: GNAT family N-acetyltransferase [Nakamurella sp.]
MATSRVRPALPDDPALLATLQRSWWRDAYATLLPANVLDMDEAALAEAWTMQLIGARGLIAEERTHPVGFALVDPRVGDDGVGRVEVLGVVPRWARRGHGGRLLVEAARILHESGAEAGALWAIEEDESIAQFVAGAGWAPSGKRRVLDTGDGQLIEIEYSGTLHLHLDDEDDDDES